MSPVLAIFAVTVLAVLAVLVLSLSLPRPRAATVILWVALVSPQAFTFARGDALASVQDVTAADYLRLVVPLALLAVAMVVGRRGLPRLSPTGTWYVVFLVVALMSATYSVSGLLTVGKGVQVVVQALVAVTLVDTYEDPRRFLVDLRNVVGSVLLLALLGTFLRPDAAWMRSPTSSEIRLQGGIPPIQPDTLGFVAGVALLVVVYGWAQTPRLVDRLSLPIALVALVVLLATRSRSPLLPLAVLVAWAVWRRGMHLAALGALLLGTLAASPWGSTAAEVVASWLRRGQTYEQLTSLTGRLDVWASALRLWELSPLVGRGFYAGHRLDPSLFGNAALSTLDSTWIETAVGLGLVGVLLLAAVFVASVVQLARHGVPGGCRPTLAALVLFVAAASFYNSSIQGFGLNSSLALVVLLAAGSAWRASEPSATGPSLSSGQSGPTRWSRASLPVPSAERVGPRDPVAR